MQPNISVQVDGLKELVRDFKRAGDAESAKALRLANKAAVEQVVERARPNVPVRTGRLQGSVRALASQRDGRAVAGTQAVPYAAAIHWGTKARLGLRGPHNIRRRPFLWDAAKAMRDQGELERVYLAEFDKILNLFRQGR